MSRTFKKQPAGDRPKKMKNHNEKRSSVKRTKYYDYADDEMND
jgi:hypothetical protein